ncbi:MAG: glucose-1-phosphate adenylyltransferase, partial [Gammaproteobacteria bacterium]
EGSQLHQAVVLPRVTIGQNCKITRAIIDEGCDIPDGTIIGEDRDADTKRFHVTDGGVALVCPYML